MLIHVYCTAVTAPNCANTNKNIIAYWTSWHNSNKKKRKSCSFTR